ncbi:DUF1499 domain-containing protein [Halobacillus seohaensis]|uniref:DUF1499 domain-containing protein n=1 Tax=Halobacillus seohaensis TaxID=447421 RepID=A0ABW2EPC8_9BACI
MTEIYLGIKDGQLAPCPKSPNCVSTSTEDYDKSMEPLPLLRSLTKTKKTIRSLIHQMERCEIIEETDNYLYVIFKSKVMKFKDDVEFYLNEETGLLHFRSSSRIGYSDFGVNRKRMEKFSESYNQIYESEDFHEL